jgi:glycosyltransferase involved in cell wall biosynthesis
MLVRTEVRRSGLAVVMSAFIGGGAQRDMILLCNALAARGVAVTFLVLRDEGPLRPLLDPAISVIEIGARKLRYAIPGLRRAIRDVAPAAVISSEASFNLCTLIAVRTLPRRDRATLILREAGSPSIAQYHDPYRQHRIAYRILRRLYRHADRVITLTEGARVDLIHNFSVPEQIVSVMRSNAVVPEATAKRLAQWDGESGRAGDLIVCVGRLSPEKDHRTLLRAVSMLPASRPWRLAIVGEGPERTALEAFARKLGIAERVIFTGPVADPFPWMMQARITVCSSRYEGLGNAIIEALACGTPVVSTDCPYGPREILQDGRYGTLTPISDAVAMADAIAAALDAVPDRRALMRRGLDYTAEHAAEAFLDIVYEVAAISPHIKRAPAIVAQPERSHA